MKSLPQNIEALLENIQQECEVPCDHHGDSAACFTKDALREAISALACDSETDALIVAGWVPYVLWSIPGHIEGYSRKEALAHMREHRE